MENIDIVITYVDGNEKKWQQKRTQYECSRNGDAGAARYRDWENLQYIFRGIEKYAPWVRKVFLVTDHQAPEWINKECGKLVLINHEDYIPEEFLPTFNTNVIENNFHRIEGLSERFIVLNDDFFLMNELKPDDFFYQGKPQTIFMEYPVGCGGNSEVFPHLLINNYNLLGKYFKRRDYKKKLRGKILNPHYGMLFFYNLIMYLMPFPNLFGILTPHFACPYTKSSFQEMWKREEEKLTETNRHRFRQSDDLTIYLFHLFDVLSGNFHPHNTLKDGKFLVIREDDPEIYETLKSGRYKLLCLNDECPEELFERVKDKVNSCLYERFPDKSMFEK